MPNYVEECRNFVFEKNMLIYLLTGNFFFTKFILIVSFDLKSSTYVTHESEFKMCYSQSNIFPQ